MPTTHDTSVNHWSAATAATRYARLFSSSIAIVLAILVAPPAIAAATDDTYRLETGDRIKITVFGQPEMSGDAVVGGDGNIVMPLVDSLRVRALTVHDAQTAIQKRLADGILQHPVVSVQIAELRPLYILGDVRTPGAYPYRFGMTVQKAVALAGGFGAAETVRGASVVDFLAAEERVQQLVHQREMLRLRAERLTAEIAGSDSFTPSPPSDTTLSPAILAATAHEKDAFTTQMALLHRQVELLRSQKPRLESEIDALKRQITTAESQLEMVNQQVKNYNQLVRQGLGTSNNDFQFRIMQSTQEGAIWRLAADVSRLQRESDELDIKIEEAKASFKRRAAAELQEARTRLNDIETALPAARAIRQVRLQYIGEFERIGLQRSIVITRIRGGETTTIKADEITTLEPGDTVNVERPVTLHSGLPKKENNAVDPKEKTDSTLSVLGEIREPTRAPVQ